MFWSMVYASRGVSYTELKSMDLAEFWQAVEAKILYQDEWSKENN